MHPLKHMTHMHKDTNMYPKNHKQCSLASTKPPHTEPDPLGLPLPLLRSVPLRWADHTLGWAVGALARAEGARVQLVAAWPDQTLVAVDMKTPLAELLLPIEDNPRQILSMLFQNSHILMQKVLLKASKAQLPPGFINIQYILTV